jgi:hypothetical protein
LFTTGYKRLAEEGWWGGGGEIDGRFFDGVLMGDFDWLPLPLSLAVVCLHQSSFLHQELYTQALEKLS